MRRSTLLWGVGMMAAGWLCLGVPAQAHQEHHGQDRFVEYLEHKLHLTPDQTAQVQRIVEEAATQRRALYDQFNTQLQQLQRTKCDRIQVLLTKEQQAAFAPIRAKHEERMEKKAEKHRR